MRAVDTRGGAIFVYPSSRHLLLVFAVVLLALCSAPPGGCAGAAANLNMHLAKHPGMCGLVFQTPACWHPTAVPSRPQGASRPRPAATPATQTCSMDTCALNPPAVPMQRLAAAPRTQPSRRTRAVAAQALASTTVETQKWWKKQSELWVDCHTDEQFYHEINSGDRLVFVDFFATWCNGCQRSYPELCKLAMDPDIQKNFKFVKVCIEELKKASKEAGIKALPHAQIYKPGEGKLVGIDIPPSRVKHLRHNLQIILGNPGKSFLTDPNGFVIPVNKTAEQQKEDAKAAAAALESATGSLFDHLVKEVLGQPSPAGSSSSSSSNGTGTSSSSSSRDTAATTPATSSSSSSSSNGTGAAATAAAPADPALAAAKAAFLEQHGSEYGYKGQIDVLYPCEVGCRMKPNEHYMDYTGSSVYCQSQLDEVFKELRSNMYGNPHSANPSSSLTSDKVEEVRDMVLRYFNADPAEYQVVFTRSATGALKLVGETFPWAPGSTFAYLRENHNSVLGMREYALEAGGHFQAVNETFVEAWLGNQECDASVLERLDNTAVALAGSEPLQNLFAFPAEDNFAGVKYPLRWVEAIKAKSTSAAQWRVLVDAAAYVPTQPLDLSQVPADFVALSFYKMFGYPTGLGALVVRVDAAELLRKLFWGGGTVALATSNADFHVLKCRPADKLEDGTVNFLDIIALKHGFAMFAKLGGIRAIQSHVASLTEYLYGELSTLKHSNGRPMLDIFGKHDEPESRSVQGGILNFELLKPDGGVHSYRTFEREAAEAGFHVRTGAACNPGACYAELGVQESEVESLAGKKEGCHDDVEFITVERGPAAPGRVPAIVPSEEVLKVVANSSVDLGHPAEVASHWVQVPLGSVRVSLGYMSTFEDCYALARFIAATYKDRA